MHSQSTLAAVVGLLSAAAEARPRTLQARTLNQQSTPALGWNSWNAFGCSGGSASAAMTAANQFKSLGLAAVGYEYVNIDDCWTSSSRDSSGNLVADPSKWPNGVKYVADQIHSMGLKFGLYGDAGQQTCAGHPGSAGHETQDAQLLSSWGVDFWKYDNCYTDCNGQYPQTCWGVNRDIETWYQTMGNALSSVSHPIMYNLCAWGQDNVWQWGKSVGGASWRMSNDISDTWSSVASIAAAAEGIAQYSGPGGFNDLDMLEIGNGGLSAAEERAHFGLWAIAKSPLVIGTDLSKISSSSLAILKNADIIAINQDALGKPATYFTPKGVAGPGSGLYQYWAGPLSDGVVIGLVASNGAQSFQVNFADVPGLGSGTYSYKELYSGTTGSGTGVSVSLQSHDMAVYKVTKSGGSGSTSTTAKPTSTKSSTTTTSGSSGAGGSAAQYAQCGGNGWTGPTTCVSPYKCTVLNAYYSQCL